MELVILCGLQASGKSTFRRGRFPDHQVVSKDLMGKGSRKERRQRRLIDEALTAGLSVVVDNTNPSPDDRAPLVEIGRRHGAKIVAFFFESDLDACVARNLTRPEDEVVRIVGMLDVQRRLQPPSPAEGFDELWYVSLSGDGRFDVGPLAAVGVEDG